MYESSVTMSVGIVIQIYVLCEMINKCCRCTPAPVSKKGNMSFKPQQGTAKLEMQALQNFVISIH